jgi:hypothetical protein
MNKIICLWSCPRNVSTALMYSFAQRKDTKVSDEVLYAHYLRTTGALHPARKEILQSIENDGNKVVRGIILQRSKKILFHKLMAHFLIDIDTAFLSKVSNIILIRDPEEIIASYSKVIENPKLDDIGIKKQYEMYLLLEKRKHTPIILDSKNLLKDPRLVLSKLCDILEIPFDKKMLKWKKGGRNEDGVWAKYWYENTHNSTSFLPYSERKIKLSSSNMKLANDCKPYYKFLTDKSILL